MAAPGKEGWDRSADDNPFSLESHSLTKPSQRMYAVISQIPLLKGIDREILQEIIQASRLLIIEPDQYVFHQGDIGKSMFVILDGEVRIFLAAIQGRDLPLAVLSEPEFFGEMSFLSGVPRNASAQAVTNTLLCELSFENMRWLVNRCPDVKRIMVKYYRQRMAKTAAKKRENGIKDRRKHSRTNVTLPVDLSLNVADSRQDGLEGIVVRALTKNISASGLQIRILDPRLKKTPMGTGARVGIKLPPPWATVWCEGVVKNISQNQAQPNYTYLGIEYSYMEESLKDTLIKFLSPRCFIGVGQNLRYSVSSYNR